MRKADELEITTAYIRVRIGGEWLVAHSVEMSIRGIFAKIINEKYQDETVEIPIGGNDE